MFAVDDPSQAVETIRIYGLANLEDPEGSKFIVKIRSGHNGFTEELAQEVLEGIEAWALALSGITVPPPPDTEPPEIMLSSPADGAVIMNTVLISAAALDNVGVEGVQFYLDNVAFGSEDTSGPYEINWNTSQVSNGAHILRARARDAAGNTRDSFNITINVANPVPDTTNPTVSLTAPANDSNASGSITISASASDNVGVAGVQFLVDGVERGNEVTSAPYSISLNTTGLTNGVHSITARARDMAGNMATSAARTINVSNVVADTILPTVSITAPTGGSTVLDTVTIEATASDNAGISGVQFYLDGVALGAEDTTSPYSVSWNTSTVTNGTKSLTARARDTSDNVSTSSAVTVTVQNTPVANPNATYTWIAQNILNPRCVQCHRSGDAESGKRYDTYTETMKSVRAGNPGASTLYRITNSGSMPESGSRLNATQMQAISDWIAAGALNN